MREIHMYLAVYLKSVVNLFFTIALNRKQCNLGVQVKHKSIFGK